MEYSTFMLLLLIACSTVTSTEGFDTFDPTGNITIRWDVNEWTSDGYIAIVTMYNFQQYRHIQAPGWSLGWTWARKEVIWNMVGGQTTEQGDCSKFKGSLPHCCKEDPTVVDLLPGVPYNQQTSKCCKGGVLSSWAQDPSRAVSSFQLTVGLSGTSNQTIKLPNKFTLKAPGPGYTCGPAKHVAPTKYFSNDMRRFTQAFMTWEVSCTYSQFLAQSTPSCCVSLSSFYNDSIVNCPTCTCGCKNKTDPGSCVNPNSPHLPSLVSSSNDLTTPLVQCTSHMCPVRVHWHVMVNYKEYWRVKVTVTNFNYRVNYSDWDLVVQHPNFNNVTQIFSFNYKSLTPYDGFNDTGMLWGLKNYNEDLSSPSKGSVGYVQSEILFGKNRSTFTFDAGWAFPRRFIFNGDECVMPPPDIYPQLPNSCSRLVSSILSIVMGTLAYFVIF